MVKVMDLSTGETILFFGISPEKAVVCAFEQSKHNHNTWDYDYSQAKISDSGKTVSCGDFCAIIK